MLDVASTRLNAHGLLSPQTNNIANIVSKMGAMQAQDYNGGLWSVGVRMQNPNLDDVTSALNTFEIVRTWPMRGTLHLVAAKDVRWMVALLGPRACASAAGRRRALGIDEAVLKSARSVLGSILAGSNGIPRSDIYKAFKSNGITGDSQHGNHLLRYFSEQSLIIHGPHNGKEPTFALLEEHIPLSKQMSREDSLIELARRFFTSHGPASLKDFVGWSMLTRTDARFGLNEVIAELESIDIDGVAYYYAHEFVSEAVDSTLLLTGFDEYVLGYKDRSQIVPIKYADRIVPGNNGMFLASVVSNGKVIGLWKKQQQASGIKCTVALFKHQRKTMHQNIQVAADRYADFLSKPISTTII